MIGSVQGKQWGHTSPIFEHNNCQCYYIMVKKGGYCSRHSHRHKFNRFVVLSGRLKVSIFREYAGKIVEDVTIIEAGQITDVPPGVEHQFEGIENTTALEFYWVELDPDDITRSTVGGLHEFF